MNRDLLFFLTVKQLKTRYKTTTLGFLWAFLNPIIQMTTLFLIFSLFFKIQVKNYPLFLICGLFPWNFFNSAINTATTSLVNNRDLLKSTPFNRSLIPLSTAASELVIFLLSLIPLVIILFLGYILTQSSVFVPNFILLTGALIIQIVLVSGLSLLTSSLEIFYRDVAFIVQAILPVWFYLTPIIYPLSFVPKNLQAFYMINPMVGIINLYQFSLGGISDINWQTVFFSIIISVILLLIGIRLFKHKETEFADWI